MSAQTPVPSLLRSFFEDYLAAQRDVSQNTIYAYRDAIKLFLRFAARHRGRQLLRLQLADLGHGRAVSHLLQPAQSIGIHIHDYRSLVS